MDITSTTTSESLAQLREDSLNKDLATREQYFTVSDALNNRPKFLEKIIGFRKVQEQAIHYGKDCYCYQSKEDQLIPKDANEIKIKILTDIKNGIEILKGNEKNGYVIRYDISEIEQFNRALELLHSNTIDISKLGIIKPYNSKKFKYAEGTNQSGYTVIYNNVELFTIINTDSKTRFPKDGAPGLSFDLRFHAGFDEVYNDINIVTHDNSLNAKDRIEADINSAIKIYKDKWSNAKYRTRTSIFRESIISFDKILQLLKTDSIDIDKLQTIDFFSDDISSTMGYTVVYNGVKLFTITNVDELIFETKYTRIKDFKVDFHNGFDELYNSLDSIILTNAIKTKNCIEDDLKEALEVIIENDNIDTAKKIADINKILQLLNSNAISIIKLKTIDVLVANDDIPNFDYEDVYDNYVETCYNVAHDGNELFSVSETTIRTPEQLGKEKYFNVELFDYFNELYSSLALSDKPVFNDDNN
jgi:hypothetical protein